MDTGPMIDFFKLFGLGVLVIAVILFIVLLFVFKIVCH